MRIHIAPNVLRLIASKAALQVDGVTRVISKPWSRGGVSLKVVDHKLELTLRLALRYGVDIMEVSKKVQEEVKRALENLVDVEVSSIDLIVEDIDLEDAQAKK